MAPSRGLALLALALAVPACKGGNGATPPPPAEGCAAGAPVPGTPNLTTVRVVRGLRAPLDLQAPPGDRERLFVVEQAGRIRIVRNGTLLEPPFLDIAARIASGGEQGLLGLAFHPRYAENRRFFVNYTDRNGDTRISEFLASSNPERAEPAVERQLLFVNQPFPNHNGGGLAFGPDGKLYIGLGDGGSGGDPFGNGQRLDTLLGKLLRIDVDQGEPYGIPADNPFLARAGARPEIFAFGLRNPWRFAFDRSTGELLIGDVGQNRVEEIDLARRGGGDNFGWNVMEGSRCFQPSSGCNTSGLTLPIAEYGHDEGCSVTGGVVYRGCRMPGYGGTFFYADYCTGLIRSLRVEAGRAVDRRDWTSSLGRGVDGISSFGLDADGEAYIVDHEDGEIYRIVPEG